MKKTYYSYGKLLITGEYLVLNGAKSLALPTKFGQFLEIEQIAENKIIWTSFDNDKSIWFDETLTFQEIFSETKSENKIKTILLKILNQAHQQNSNIFNVTTGFRVTTSLTFPKNWGLGTSSTLINNIAQWFNIDAFVLLNNSFGGSGYDIACAQNNTPIVYELKNGLPKIEKVFFEPKYKDNLYFLYLNRKQNSGIAIENFKKKQFDLIKSNILINEITNEIILAKDFDTAVKLFEKHETILSGLLNTPTIKRQLFSDFFGEIKSLGAWGGDFVLVLSQENPKDYFKEKGYHTLLKYSDMIL